MNREDRKWDSFGDDKNVAETGMVVWCILVSSQL
jgi:hypothetical protein